MTDAQLTGLVTQVPVVIDPSTISARLTGLVAQVAVATVQPPLTVVVAQASTTSLTLTWADNPIADHPLLQYEVMIDNGTPINKGSSLTHTFTGLTNGLTYNVAVRSIDTAGYVSEWIARGFTLLASPSDNAFDSTPWIESTTPSKASKKWQPFTYLGTGKQLIDLDALDDSASRVAYPSEIIPVIKSGTNRRVTILPAVNPNLLDEELAQQVGVVHSGAGSSQNTPLSLYSLDPGIWRVKVICLENRSASSINGGLYFTTSGGTVTHFAFTKKFVSSATAGKTNRQQNFTSNTSVKVEGGAQRAVNTSFSTPDGVDSLEVMAVYIGVVVVTARTQFITMGFSGTGGGNNLQALAGTNISFDKMG